MILLGLLIYDQTHAQLLRVFNNLAISYGQAHGVYDQTHGLDFSKTLASHCF